MRVMAIVNPGSDEDVPDLAAECGSVGGLLGLQLQLQHLAEYGAAHKGLDVSEWGRGGDPGAPAGQVAGETVARGDVGANGWRSTAGERARCSSG
jgi:hypothetical protein